jgi:hypothetical protein
LWDNKMMKVRSAPPFCTDILSKSTWHSTALRNAAPSTAVPALTCSCAKVKQLGAVWDQDRCKPPGGADPSLGTSLRRASIFSVGLESYFSTIQSIFVSNLRSPFTRRQPAGKREKDQATLQHVLQPADFGRGPRVEMTGLCWGLSRSSTSGRQLALTLQKGGFSARVHPMS